MNVIKIVLYQVWVTLAVVLIVLKALDLIDLDWLWVLSPLWIPFVWNIIYHIFYAFWNNI